MRVCRRVLIVLVVLVVLIVLIVWGALGFF